MRGETFVTRKIMRGLARIKVHLDDCLYLGNLDALRDWGHARDYVRAQFKNRKLIGHNPYNSPGHHGFARDRGAFERFFENTIPERLATVFRDLILEYYALVRSDGDKPAPLFFAEKSALDDAPRQAARRFFGEIREVVLVRDPRDLMCSAMSFWGYSGPDALKMLGETLPQLEAIHDAVTPDTFFLRY